MSMRIELNFRVGEKWRGKGWRETEGGLASNNRFSITYDVVGQLSKVK